MPVPTTRCTSGTAGVVAAVALALGVAGCGSSGTSGSTGATGTAVSTPATVTAPRVPDATLKGDTGQVTLAHSSSCWRDASAGGGMGVCADYVAPTCHDGTTPHLAVAPGERLYLHLDLPANPSEVTAGTVSGTPTQLTKARDVTWTAPAKLGAVVFGTRVEGYGDATWAVCLVPKG